VRDETERHFDRVEQEQQRILDEEGDDARARSLGHEGHAVGHGRTGRDCGRDAKGLSDAVRDERAVDALHDSARGAPDVHRDRDEEHDRDREQRRADRDSRGLRAVHAPAPRFEEQLGRQRTDVELRADEGRAERDSGEQQCDAGAFERVFETLSDIHPCVGLAEIDRCLIDAAAVLLCHPTGDRIEVRPVASVTLGRRDADRDHDDQGGDQQRSPHHPPGEESPELGVELSHDGCSSVSSRKTSSSERATGDSSDR
jgi:hypothetical protein